jgi:CubicO group peptidase (beta-lactamase class C family)
MLTVCLAFGATVLALAGGSGIRAVGLLLLLGALVRARQPSAVVAGGIAGAYACAFALRSTGSGWMLLTAAAAGFGVMALTTELVLRLARSKRTAKVLLLAVPLAVLAAGQFVPGIPDSPSGRQVLAPAVQRRVDTFVRRSMRASGTPGVAVAVVQGDSVFYLRGYGHAAPGREVTPTTPFVLGSTGKSFTAFAVLQAAEDGLLALDDPVVSHLRAFTLQDRAAARVITIRDLLRQTTGLSQARGGAGILAANAGWSLARGIRELGKVEPERPQQTWRYSNANYLVAGAVLEAASDMPYAQWMHDRIFVPAGMTMTSAEAGEVGAGPQATAYDTWFGLRLPLRARTEPVMVPAGGIASSATDLARYLRLLLNDGVIDGRRLLSADGVHALFAPAAAVPGSSDHYGFGWQVDRTGDAEHSGVAYGTSSHLW